MRRSTLAVLFSYVFLLSGCGVYRLGSTTATQYTLDGVKRIAPGLDGQNNTAWGQSTYTVNSTSRLLMRYEKLSKCVSKIDTSGGNKVQVYISLNDTAQMAAATTDLNLCSLNANWMMLADWEKRHPFGGGAPWTNSGGDYSDCVTGTASTAKTLVFDMTNWFLDYPKGRNANYGLILTSASAITIIGEISGSYSPRIEFQSSYSAPCN